MLSKCGFLMLSPAQVQVAKLHSQKLIAARPSLQGRVFHGAGKRLTDLLLEIYVWHLELLGSFFGEWKQRFIEVAKRAVFEIQKSSHLQPLAATRVAASGCKWPLGQVAANGRKCPQVAAIGRKWPQVAASGR